MKYLIEYDDFVDWVYDFLLLLDNDCIKRINLHDFSLYLQPICKAFEKYLFDILQSVGYIPFIPEIKPKHLGRYLYDNEGKNKEAFSEYIDMISNSEQTSKDYKRNIDLKTKKELLDHIIIIGSMYHRYRNLYMHADTKKAKSIEEVRNIGGSIIKEINDFTQLAADSGINTHITNIINE